MSAESGFVHYWVKQKHHYKRHFSNKLKEILKFVERAYFDGYNDEFAVEPFMEYREEIKKNNYNDNDRHYIEMYMHFAFDKGKRQR